MRTILLGVALLALTSCAGKICVLPCEEFEEPVISLGEWECYVVETCSVLWGASFAGRCECIDYYQDMTVKCQQAYQELTTCLHDHGCSMSKCVYSMPIETYEECDFQI
jgi:hypothetical protein